MKKLFFVSLGVLTISSVAGIIYLYSLLSATLHDADKYHPPAVTPIVPRASANK